MKNDGAVTDLAQAAAQKITGASDDVMAKVRGILEEELSDAETDIRGRLTRLGSWTAKRPR